MIRDNVFLDNTTGMLVDGCNRVHAANNQFRSNGWALRLFSNSTGCRFRKEMSSREYLRHEHQWRIDAERSTGNYWDAVRRL